MIVCNTCFKKFDKFPEKICDCGGNTYLEGQIVINEKSGKKDAQPKCGCAKLQIDAFASGPDSDLYVCVCKTHGTKVIIKDIKNKKEGK